MTNDELREAIIAVKNILTWIAGDANAKHYQALVSLIEQYLALEDWPEEKITYEGVWGEEESYKAGFNEALRLCKLAVLRDKNKEA